MNILVIGCDQVGASLIRDLERIGAGLHVGHPLGYIASDIYARYKRLQGFNVLNPMG